ncbi:RagB/SusD domain-containing protein [Gemmatirosa kalamazoonensis]|uniref:RagB/SusD domain-containing protein n=1 Tax=Gemmatirosa kalamazoonensis TaxID=861299 RepID=W0RH67_9BACT|nr:RagB/SusD family nutrient uptake outer membrane protein [Gemmatirosa kalamazoonensis]AHG88728.1 RagB/SusD domain-containing protein [Gemmatirosa kalamazoonensis]
MYTRIKISTAAKAVATAVLAVSAVACKDDFLTEKPVDFVSPVNFYQNAGDAIAAVNAAYATFVTVPDAGNDSYVGRNFVMLTEYPTEVTTSRLSASNERSMIGNFHPQFTSTHPYLEGVWQAAYSGINRANSVIDHVPAITMDETRKAQIVGEAKFLRALHYYWLAGLFGGVPLKLTETVGIDGDVLARATVAETYAQIAKDLTEAAAALPASWPASDFGRATKGAALTLLGKAYLQSAGQFGITANYQKALDTFKQVQTMGYTLDPNYASLFDGSNERSSEIIWSIQNVRVSGYGGRLTQWFVPVTTPALYSSVQNQFQAERPFYDSYNAADIRKAGTWMTSFTKPNGQTVTWSYATTNITTAANYGSTGPTPRKYVDLGAPSGGAEAPDYVVLRYADVLLSAAEAANEVSGPNAEAYGYVNQVRARAKVPNLTAGLSKQAFKDSLYVERRYELALEFHGVFDMRRDWAFAKGRVEANLRQASTLNKSPFTSSVEKPATSTSLTVDDKWQLYPIPARACELNSALTQNPGWADGICK